MSIDQLRKRADRLAADVSAKMADVQAGRITQKQFSEFIGGAEAQQDEIYTGIKNYERALKFRAGPGESSSPHDLDSGQRLSFKGMGAAFADKVLGGELGAKALAPSGAAVIDQEFRPNPIALGQVATGLLDVLPVQAHPSAEYAYLRQTTRTNNAAVVADGATKPTSVYSVTRIEQSLAIVAHLSEAVPRYWFIDNSGLQGFINNELAYGLNLAVEAKVMTDINATSGIQTQVYSTSVLQTLRKSVTKLELSGLVASSIVLHPSDWEGVELALSTTNAVEHMSLPYDPATRRLFGVPIVTTVSQAAGVSHTLAKDAVLVDTDNHGVGVQWSETSNADDFAKNLIRARCEGRFGTSVLSPLGVVVGDLTA
ncbi:phage major capsid protein [Mycolicibacterium sp. CR10]|uniref:phage major capsid protein n=1 Tax=Mycolicibacterium sp. CR10 TaxID=2562314 RepID=UPI001F0EC8A3|nr:phage major capsid protein [Mycolicibacterium sp. CR10]